MYDLKILICLPANGHLVFKEIWTQQLALGEIQNSHMWWLWVLSLVLFLVCVRP